MNNKVIDELIRLVYSGISEETPWQSFISHLRKALSGSMASFQLYTYSFKSSRLSIYDSDPDLDMDRFYIEFIKYYKDADYLFGPVEPGTVITFKDMTSRRSLEESDFFRNFMKPNDFGDALKFGIIEEDGCKAWLDIGRSVNAALFSERDKQLCYAIIPHLERALSIYSKIRKLESERDVLDSLIEQFTVGMVFLNDNFEVIRTNYLVEDLIRDSDAISIKYNRFNLLDPTKHQTLQSALKNAIRQREKFGDIKTIDAIGVTRNSNSKLGVIIKSIPESRWLVGDKSPAIIICLFDPDQHQNAKRDFVSQVFDLSPSEANLAILLSKGETLANSAKILCVSEHTTRAASKRIFSKLGINRQADLVRIIVRYTSLLS